MKRAFKIPLLTLSILIFAVIAFFTFLTIVEYRPKDTEKVQVADALLQEAKKLTEKRLSLNKEYSVITWNTGYGALGKNADFFMDGGKMVNTASKNLVQENISKIAQGLKDENPDFIFLQEVDVKSKRSHRINQEEFYRQAFASYQNAFAVNYKVPFIPYPLPPIGKVYGGIQTLSRYKIFEAQRIALPTSFKWPVRLGNLKRCLLISRLAVEGSNKELVLINLHLEAYDSGEGKIMQTNLLKSVIRSELEKGNYVIAGGDFNQQFSSTDASDFPSQGETFWQPGIIDESEFEEGLNFVQPNDIASCRSLDKAYEGQAKENFQLYIIDGFILSKNINVTSAQTIDKNFENTDHNPIKITFTLDQQ